MSQPELSKWRRKKAGPCYGTPAASNPLRQPRPGSASAESIQLRSTGRRLQGIRTMPLLNRVQDHRPLEQLPVGIAFSIVAKLRKPRRIEQPLHPAGNPAEAGE